MMKASSTVDLHIFSVLKLRQAFYKMLEIASLKGNVQVNESAGAGMSAAQGDR